MLKIGDKPEEFTNIVEYGGTGDPYNFTEAGYTGKVTILSFIDINNGWGFLYNLFKLRAELNVADVDVIAVIFDSTGSINANDVNQKFPFPIGSSDEKRFTSNDLQNTTGLTVLLDNTWASSIASTYRGGFDDPPDASFDGSPGSISWTYIISKSFYITDKWNTNCTTNNDPISFNRLKLNISRLDITGTFAAGNTARVALDSLGLAGNYIDISYDGTQYTYGVTAPDVASVTPTDGTTSSNPEPITIEFTGDTPSAASSDNYTLTTEAGDTISGLAVSSLLYSSEFNSGYFSIAERYIAERVSNLLAAPKVLEVIPQPGSTINDLPGSKIDIVLSKPVGNIDGAASVAILDTSDVKIMTNYNMPEPNGFTPGPVLYENSGLRSANIENIGKIENVITLKFSGSLEDGPFSIRVNDNAAAGERITDTEGNEIEGNNGDAYYTIAYTVVTYPTVINVRVNPHLDK